MASVLSAVDEMFTTGTGTYLHARFMQEAASEPPRGQDSCLQEFITG